MSNKIESINELRKLARELHYLGLVPPFHLSINPEIGISFQSFISVDEYGDGVFVGDIYEYGACEEFRFRWIDGCCKNALEIKVKVVSGDYKTPLYCPECGKKL